MMAHELLGLRKEVERLRRELKDLRSERAIAVYREGIKELPDYSPADVDTFARLRTENERLRGAMKELIGGSVMPMGWNVTAADVFADRKLIRELRQENERLREDNLSLVNRLELEGAKLESFQREIARLRLLSREGDNDDGWVPEGRQ